MIQYFFSIAWVGVIVFLYFSFKICYSREVLVESISNEILSGIIFKSVKENQTDSTVLNNIIDYHPFSITPEKYNENLLVRSSLLSIRDDGEEDNQKIPKSVEDDEHP